MVYLVAHNPQTAVWLRERQLIRRVPEEEAA
jgi:hypothetical protein